MGWKTQSNLNFVENAGQPLEFGFHVLNVDLRTLQTPYFALNVEKDFQGAQNRRKGHNVNAEIAVISTNSKPSSALPVEKE